MKVRKKQIASLWVAMNFRAKEFPLSKHFTYHYVNLICTEDELKCSTGLLCSVCMFCGSPDQSETHNSHPLNLSSSLF